MEFRIADTFATSLAKLTDDEQKSAKTTAFNLQLSPANPRLSLHKLDRAKDRRFWSVRASLDVRLIVHKTNRSLRPRQLLSCLSRPYDTKYPKATRCLQKDREELMAFYDFPVMHGQSIRTSNPIESAIAPSAQRAASQETGCCI